MRRDDLITMLRRLATPLNVIGWFVCPRCGYRARLRAKVKP